MTAQGSVVKAKKAPSASLTQTVDLKVSWSSLRRELVVSQRQGGLLHVTYFQHTRTDVMISFSRLFRAQNRTCMFQLQKSSKHFSRGQPWEFVINFFF